MRPRRRRRRWWGPALAVLISAAAFGLFAQIDLDSVRGRAVDAVSAWLGHPVILGGRLGIRFSDGPVLLLPELEVGDKMLSVREVRIAVRLWPLLLGRLEPKAVTLVGPRFRLQALASWRSATGEWPALPIERLEIVEGTLDGLEGEMVEQLALTIVPASPTGPFDIRGTGRRNGEVLRLEVTLGRLEPGRPVGFASRVQGAGIDASLAGAVNRGTDGLELGGPLKLTAADAAKFLARIGIVAAPLAGPAKAEAKFAWAEGRVILSELAFEAGGLRVTGRIDLAESLRAGETQLAFGRLELERWRETIAGLLGGAGGRDISALLSAEAVDLRGALVRQVRAEIRLLDRQMALRQLSALAPGGTEITIFGRIDSTATAPVYEGEVDLVSDNLRLALAWLGLEPTGIAPDRLRRAAASFRMSFDGRRLTMTSLDLKLDTSRMRGSGNLALTPAPRVDLRLAVDRMTLDPYLPLLAAAIAAGVGGTVAVSADALTWQGLGLRDVEIEIGLADRVMDLHRLRIAEVAGARFAAAGRVALDGGASELSFDLTTSRPSDLLRLFGNGDVAGIPVGKTMAAAGRLNGALADLALTGAIVSPEGTTGLDGAVRFAGPGVAVFEPGPELRRLIDALAARGR